MILSDPWKPGIGRFLCRVDRIAVLIWFISSVQILSYLLVKIDPDLFAHRSTVRSLSGTTSREGCSIRNGWSMGFETLITSCIFHCANKFNTDPGEWNLYMKACCKWTILDPYFPNLGNCNISMYGLKFSEQWVTEFMWNWQRVSRSFYFNIWVVRETTRLRRRPF